MTENTTPLLLEEIQSRLQNILLECENLYNNLNGDQTDIECGTLIKTRTDAGSATLSIPYKSTPGHLTIYFKKEILTSDQIVHRQTELMS